MVAVERGGCRRTWAEVSSGHDVKWPASMAAHQVEREGENMVA